MIDHNKFSVRVHNLYVSEHLFRLVTEGIRLISNKYKQIYSLDDLIRDRVNSIEFLIMNYRKESLATHFSIIPNNGEILLKITIDQQVESKLHGFLSLINEEFQGLASFASAISLMIFDLIVEENRTEVMSKLALSEEDAAAFKIAAKRTDTNVVPLW